LERRKKYSLRVPKRPRKTLPEENRGKKKFQKRRMLLTIRKIRKRRGGIRRPNPDKAKGRFTYNFKRAKRKLTRENDTIPSK